MILFDIFAAHVSCPACGDPAARQFLWMVKCRNMACLHFDPAFLHAEQAQGMAPDPRFAKKVRYRSAQTGERGTRTRGTDFRVPMGERIEVRYQNFRGERKTFMGDRRTVRRRGNHISVCVEPTGQRLALSRERIENRDELEGIAQQSPATVLTPRERQIVGYHRRHGTTSPRYLEILRKYPHLA